MMVVEIKIYSCPFGLFPVSKSNCESALSSPQKTTNALDEQTTQASFCFRFSRLQFIAAKPVMQRSVRHIFPCFMRVEKSDWTTKYYYYKIPYQPKWC